MPPLLTLEIWLGPLAGGQCTDLDKAQVLLQLPWTLHGWSPDPNPKSLHHAALRWAATGSTALGCHTQLQASELASSAAAAAATPAAAWLPATPNIPAPRFYTLPQPGEPVSSKLSPEGQRGPGALEGAAAGEAPTQEQRAAIADLHEPDPSLPKGEWGLLRGCPVRVQLHGRAWAEHGQPLGSTEGRAVRAGAASVSLKRRFVSCPAVP